MPRFFEDAVAAALTAVIVVLCCCSVCCALQWSNMHVTVRGQPYKMLRMHFMPRCSPGGGSP